jgi:hypothetical protein
MNDNSTIYALQSDQRVGGQAAAHPAIIEQEINYQPIEGEHSSFTPLSASHLIQRKCAHCEEEEEKEQDQLQRKPDALLLRTTGTESTASFDMNGMESELNSRKGSGQSMDGKTQSFMQSWFSADFSSVKIHTDSDAARLNRQVNAKAFTVNNDIYFNSGAYDPISPQGKHLLAHELTHTLQQNGKGAQSQIQRQAATPPAPAVNTLSPEMLQQIARRLREAMAGPGTDEEAIYSAFSGRTNPQVAAISQTYQAMYRRDLLPDLQGELNDGEMRRLGIFNPLGDAARGIPEADAQTRSGLIANQLRNAMRGPGTDESAVMSALTGRTQEELTEIRAAYLALTRRTLESDLRDDLSGAELTEAIRLLNQGLLQPEDEIFLAIEGLGTDEDRIFRVLDSLAGNTPDIKRMENNYRSKYGDLVADLRGDLSGSEYARAMRVLEPVLADVAFEDCGPGIISAVRALVPVGLQKVEHAISVLSRGLSGMNAAELAVFNQNFDPSGSGIDAGFVNQVLSNFRLIRNEFKDGLTVECEDNNFMCNGSRVLYYTWWTDVHVCPYFHSVSTRLREIGFVHELAHNALHSVDRQYKWEPGFSNLTPRGNFTTRIPVLGYLFGFMFRSDTLYNPDSYAYFAFDVP